MLIFSIVSPVYQQYIDMISSHIPISPPASFLRGPRMAGVFRVLKPALTFKDIAALMKELDRGASSVWHESLEWGSLLVNTQGEFCLNGRPFSGWWITILRLIYLSILSINSQIDFATSQQWAGIQWWDDHFQPNFSASANTVLWILDKVPTPSKQYLTRCSVIARNLLLKKSNI